jgi:predicted porin
VLFNNVIDGGVTYVNNQYGGLASDQFGSIAFGNQYDFMFETLTLGLIPEEGPVACRNLEACDAYSTLRASD